MPARKTRFRPWMSASLPKGTRKTAAARIYAVATQPNWTASALNSRPIEGRAMFTEAPMKGARNAASPATIEAESCAFLSIAQRYILAEPRIFPKQAQNLFQLKNNLVAQELALFSCGHPDGEPVLQDRSPDNILDQLSVRNPQRVALPGQALDNRFEVFAGELQLDDFQPFIRVSGLRFDGRRKDLDCGFQFNLDDVTPGQAEGKKGRLLGLPESLENRTRCCVHQPAVAQGP